MSALAIMLKQPDETKDYLFFVQQSPAAIVHSASVSRGLVPGSSPLGLTTAMPMGAPFVQAEISGGSDGERYLVTVRAELASGEIGEAELEVVVIDASWAMPDGGVPYLAIDEFVRLFGLPETIVMTDPDGSGRIDRAYLIGALQAAQGLADINLAGRYAVPLTSVPDAIKTAIADLARARLYPRGAPEGVGVAAKSAERLLERIASGALPLPLAAGGVAAEAPSPTPVLISDRGRRRYPNGLKGCL